MHKVTMLIAFIILLSAYETLCDRHECYRNKIKTCDENLLPKGYPMTAEELRTLCDNIGVYGKCDIGVHESCGYDENLLSQMRRDLNFINRECDEDNPTYKVISSNLECIVPVVKTMSDACDAFTYSAENFEIGVKREQQFFDDNADREDVLECLANFWELSCRSIVIGLHCGEEVQEAVTEVLKGKIDRQEKCTSEILEELQPLYETFESIVEEEQKLKNAIKKHK